MFNCFCESCLWWQFVFNNGDERFGLCNHFDIKQNIRLTQAELNEDEIEVFTNALFGCNFHEKKPLILIEIKINL